MAGPWEKYQQQPAEQQSAQQGPWNKYSTPNPDPLKESIAALRSTVANTGPYSYYDPSYRRAAGIKENDIAAGAVETGLQFGSNAITMPLSGIAGIGASITNALGITDTPAAEVVRNVGDMAYQPATMVGQNISGALGYIPQKFTEASKETADRQFIDPTGEPNELLMRMGHPQLAREVGAARGSPSPLGATLQHTASQALPLLIGGNLLGSRAARVPSRVPERPPAQPMQSGFARENMGAAAASPQLTNVSPQLRQLIETQARSGRLDRTTVERRIEADTLPVRIELTEGQARQDPSLISEEMNLRGTDRRLAEFYQRQNQALIDNLDEIRAQVAPDVVAADHIQNGQALIDSYKAFDEPIRANITRLYKQLEQANGGKLPINAQSFVSQAAASLHSRLKSDFLPPAIGRQLARVRKEGSMTFEQYEALRTNLAAEARKADRAGDGNAEAAIAIVRDALENMPIDGAAAHLKPLADRARNAARARFEAMRNDPAYRSAVDDPTPAGELSPFADDFVKKYVVNGKAANIRRMQENLRNDPVAAQTVAAAALNYVKSKSGVNLYTNEGNFSQAGYNRALAEITPKLNQLLPQQYAEMAQQLGNVARMVQIQPRGSFVNNSNTLTAAMSGVAKSYGEGTLNAAVPGANLGTFIRERRRATDTRKRVDRALDPRSGINRDQ